MSSSSTREGRTETSTNSRAQVDPLVALVALFAVSVGVSLYAGVLDDVSRSVGVDRDVATPTLERVHDAATAAGVFDPSERHATLAAGPDGYDVNLTVRIDGHERQPSRTWYAGPSVPDTPPRAAIDSAGRVVSVRVTPGEILPGHLRVVVWS